MVTISCRPSKPTQTQVPEVPVTVESVKQQPVEDLAPRPNVSRGDVQAAVRASKGTYTEEVREAYLLYYESECVRYLDEAGKSLPKAFMDWVRDDSSLRDAAYGTIYPVDPRIVRNLYLLDRDLGRDFMNQFKQLVIAQAVGRRLMGVGESVTASRMKGPLVGGLAKDKASRAKGEIYWPAEPKAGPIELPTYSGWEMKKPVPTPPGQKPASMPQALFDFVHKEGITFPDLTFNRGLQLKAAEYTASVGKPMKGVVVKKKGQPPTTNDKAFRNIVCGQVLPGLGLRPAKRDPHPSAAAYCKFLGKIAPTVTKHGSLFDYVTAPWPMSLPLAKGFPLREADYIHQRFLGKVKGGGPKRIQTYGRWCKAKDYMPRQMEPMAWHENSWPAMLYQGGLCGTMSSIAEGTYSSLGKPMLKAGQPGHSCVLKYDFSKGFSKVIVGQSAGGIFTTKSVWMFADAEGASAVGVLEHMALALATNYGLKEYMDTRIICNIAGMLREAKRDELSYALLMDAIDINPYNSQIYGTLSRAPVPTLMTAIDRFRGKVKATSNAFIPLTKRDLDANIGEADEDENEAIQARTPESARIGEYRSKIMAELAAPVTKLSVADRATASKYVGWFETQVKAGESRFNRQHQQCLQVLQDATAYHTALTKDVMAHAKAKRGPVLGPKADLLRTRIDVAPAPLSAAAQIKWITALGRSFGDNTGYIEKKTQGNRKHRKVVSTPRTDPVYTYLVAKLTELKSPPAPPKKPAPKKTH